MHGLKIVFPAKNKNQLSTGYKTKLYIVDSKTGEHLFEIDSATAFSIPAVGADSIVEASVTLPLMSVEYSDRKPVMSAEQIQAEMKKFRK